MTYNINAIKQFFRGAHESINQKRKYSGKPYFTHLENTYSIAVATRQPVTVQIAMLGHDFCEDVLPQNPNYTLEMVREVVGDEVLGIIIDLTDVYTKAAYPHLNRRARHRLEVERLAKIPIRSKNAKLIDLIDNTHDIVFVHHEYPEARGFAPVYLRETQELLTHFADADFGLFSRAVEQVNQGLELLNAKTNH